MGAAVPLDPIGTYFRIFESATGQSTVFETLESSPDESRVHRFDHRSFDAFGAFRTLDPTAARVSNVEHRPSSALTRVQALVRALRDNRQIPKPRLCCAGAATTKARGWRSLSRAQTDAILYSVRSSSDRVSMAAYLLHALHRVMQRDYVSGPFRWSLPVDLRGTVKSVESEDNCAAPMSIDLDRDADLQAVHQEILRKLRENEALGVYTLLQCLARLPDALYRRILRAEEEKLERQGRWFGIMSNVGAFTGRDDIAHRMPFALVSSSTPIACASTTWNGRLSLTVHLHDRLLNEGLDAGTIVEQWKQALTAKHLRLIVDGATI